MTGNFYSNNQPRIGWAEFWGTYDSGLGGGNWTMFIQNTETYSVDFEYGIKNYTDSNFTFSSHTLSSGGTFYVDSGVTSIGETNVILLKGEVPRISCASCGSRGIYKAWFHPNLDVKLVDFGGSNVRYIDMWGAGDFEGSMFAAFDKSVAGGDLKPIINLENFNIDNVTNMNYCFRDCNLYVNAPTWALLPAPAHLVGLTTDCFNGNPNIPNRASIHSDWISD